MDQMVLATQKWLNSTYKNRTGFGSVPENGQTGWDTIYGLTRALQIELGITQTADNFGPGTQSRFSNRWPHGIAKNGNSDNVHGIIQGALWCKGYAAEYGGITTKFTDSVASSITQLKADIGLSDTSSTVDLGTMMVLLSMKQFKLMSDYGGKSYIRSAQQRINRDFRPYTGIIPADGLYGREMNTALIQVLQSLEGFSPDEATGNFGNGTRSRLQTVSGGTSDWVWLASTALACNGFSVLPARAWSNQISSAVSQFQSTYALPKTGVVDATTWMSLLTSKGDPNRSCVACDTRFEITDELAEQLKSDGYQIVGRYLSEPDMDSTAPADYFKAIRPGELQRILNHGLTFFPIFQEYSTKISHFTPESGARHGREATAHARRLGIPSTVIYFAVDVDVMDYQIDEAILPYFRAVTQSLGGGYRVGIYASRNVCTRVMESGYAISAFVSDMSTGFSGNLGFPIPATWNYDQFHEISGYGGKWDLDRVAYSHRIPPVSKLTTYSFTDYAAMQLFDLIELLETRFNELRSELSTTQFGKSSIQRGGETITVSVPTWHCVLNYLAKDYLRGSAQWAISAEPFREFDASKLEADPVAAKIIGALNKWISAKRNDWNDPSGGKIDVAHVAVTTLAYLQTNAIPDKWTGWAGDVASALSSIQKVVDMNPGVDVHRVARALVGQDEDFKSGLSGLEYPADLKNNCNFSDLRSDGDAIVLANTLKHADQSAVLAQTLRGYYFNPTTLSNRLHEIAYSVGATTLEEAKTKFWEELNGVIDDRFIEMLASGITGLYGIRGEDIRNEIKRAACDVLAEYIF